MVPRSLSFALDIVAILILTFGLYFPRHRRKDMVVAYLGVNLGVLAVTNALANEDIGLGLGLGFYGVLSIIRLRSAELDQEEIAYYFSALALGLVGGFDVSPAWLGPALMGAILAALFIGDHPRLFARYRLQTVQLDEAITDEAVLVERLGSLLGAKIHHAKIRRIDLVRDTTTVHVRYELPPGVSSSSTAGNGGSS